MFAINVMNVSSFWAGTPAHPGETLCPPGPYNSSASCGYPKWHPMQILGPPRLKGYGSVERYGDSTYSFAPGSIAGEKWKDADAYLRFDWDAPGNFLLYGYTEFVEVLFERKSYVQRVEVGEPLGGSQMARHSLGAPFDAVLYCAGMGAIVRILLMRPSGEWFTFWESLLQRGDPTLMGTFEKRSEYRVFEPLDVCQATFPTDHLRIEYDTRTVPECRIDARVARSIRLGRSCVRALAVGDFVCCAAQSDWLLSGPSVLGPIGTNSTMSR
jgi:hypothetical protein